MRSNALPYNKTSTEGENASSVSLRLPPSPTGEGIFVPPPVLVFPRRGRRPRRPARPSSADLPSTNLHRLSFAFSCWRRGTAKRWMRSASPLPPTFRQRTCTGFPLPSPAGEGGPRSGGRGVRPLSRRPFVFVSTFALHPVGVGAPDDPHALSHQPSVNNPNFRSAPSPSPVDNLTQ